TTALYYLSLTTLGRSTAGGRLYRSAPQVPLLLRAHLWSEAVQRKRDGRAHPIVHAVEHEHVGRAPLGAHVRERAVAREAECANDSVPVDLLRARVPHRAGPGPLADRWNEPAPFLRRHEFGVAEPRGHPPAGR